MRKIDFKRKQLAASNDYELAYFVINEITAGDCKTITPANIAAFRKYAYDLAAKSQKNITTRKSENQLIVYCLENK